MAPSEGPDANVNLSIEDQLFLQDMSVIVSEVTGASRRSAIAMFNNMLVKFKDQFFTGGATAKTYHELSEDEWVAHGRKWIGMFADFNFMAGGTSWSTCLGYLSGVKSDLLNRFATLAQNLFAGQVEWYTKVRQEIGKKYVKDCNKKGIRASTHSARMTAEDLESICFILLERNDLQNIIDRTVLLLQWHVMGRIAEMSHLSLKQISFNPKLGCLVLEGFTRVKTTLTQSDLHVFIHKDNWRTCADTAEHS